MTPPWVCSGEPGSQRTWKLEFDVNRGTRPDQVQGSHAIAMFTGVKMCMHALRQSPFYIWGREVRRLSQVPGISLKHAERPGKPPVELVAIGSLVPEKSALVRTHASGMRILSCGACASRASCASVNNKFALISSL